MDVCDRISWQFAIAIVGALKVLMVHVGPIATLRHGLNIVVTPFKTHRANLKIEEDREKIEEDRGELTKIEERSRKYRGKSRKNRERSRRIEEDPGDFVFLGEPFLDSVRRLRDTGFLRNFGADGLCGWTASWGQV